MSKERRFRFGKHTSIPDGLEDSIHKLLKLECVRRTILGRFYPAKNRFPKGFLKYQTDTNSGIRINGYIPSGIQEIFVSITPPSKRNIIIKYINNTYSK